MNKRNIFIIFLLILIAFLGIVSVIFSLLNMNNQNIFSGIFINGIDVSNLSKNDAETTISESINQKFNQPLTLIYNDLNFDIDLSTLNLHINTHNTVNDAYSFGRNENIIGNNYKILEAFLLKKHFFVDISFDEDSLNSVINNISEDLPNRFIQTSYYIEDKNLVITKGKEGIVIDKDELKASIMSILNDFSSEETTIQLPVKKQTPDEIDLNKIHSEIYKKVKDAYYEKDPFKVYAEVVGIDFDVKKAETTISKNPNKKEYKIKLIYTEPKITTKNLNIDIFPDLLATFSTRYDASNKSRSTNLELAAKKINGTILSPDEEFSYNKVVGERSIAAGYKEAKVYSNGQVVDGIGGGICQISTTLYDAVIFANLKITERYNHQFVVSYASPGRDATVVYGAKDLKFVNNRTYPIKIMITVNSGIAKVDIYGIKEKNEYDISFDIETVSDINYNIKYEKDSSLNDDQEIIKQAGVNGIIVNSYKVLRKSGVIVSKELLSKDSYKSLDRIIVNNTGKKD